LGGYSAQINIIACGWLVRCSVLSLSAGAGAAPTRRSQRTHSVRPRHAALSRAKRPLLHSAHRRCGDQLRRKHGIEADSDGHPPARHVGKIRILGRGQGVAAVSSASIMVGPDDNDCPGISLARPGQRYPAPEETALSCCFDAHHVA